MKKMLFLVTSVTCLYCFGQNPKWEITTLKTPKKGMGRLSLSFPDSVVWSIDLYSSSNKFITNHSYKDKRNKSDKNSFYDLPAGLYNIKLNTVLVQNVPIEEGKQTRIKAGLLRIEEDLWELRTESGKNYLTSGNRRSKMMLPVGTYQLGKSRNFKAVHISDLIGSGDLVVALDPDVQLSPFYEITNGPESLGENGKIALPLYPNFGTAVDFETGIEIHMDWPNERVLYSMRVKNETNMQFLADGDSAIIIAPGVYRVYVNEVGVPEKVTVVKGRITTIKAGFLKITKGDKDRAFGFVSPFNAYGPRGYEPFIMVLPILREADKYRLKKYKQMNPASPYDYNEIHSYIPEIKDRQLTINGKKEGVVVKFGNLF